MIKNTQNRDPIPGDIGVDENAYVYVFMTNNWAPLKTAPQPSWMKRFFRKHGGHIIAVAVFLLLYTGFGIWFTHIKLGGMWFMLVGYMIGFFFYMALDYLHEKHP
jgi:cyanate permease